MPATVLTDLLLDFKIPREMPPSKANTKGPKRPTPAKNQYTRSSLFQARPTRNQVQTDDEASSGEDNPPTPASRTRNRSKPLRPAIPVKQSFAYGSPGKVSLPVRLDSKIRQKPIVEAIEEALQNSQKVTTNGQAVQDESRSYKESSMIEDRGPEATPSTNQLILGARADEEGYQESSSFRTEDAIGAGAGFNKLGEDDEDEEEEEEEEEDDDDDGDDDEGDMTRDLAIGEEFNVNSGAHSSAWDRLIGLTSSTWSSVVHSLKASRDALLVAILLCLLCAAVLYSASFGSEILRALPELHLPYQLSSFAHRHNVGDHSLESLSSFTHAFDNKLESLSSSTRNRYDKLRDRVSKVELSYNKLAKSLNAPQPHRRINFFATGTGVLVDPYLTSPTRQLGRPSFAMLLYSFFTSLPSFRPPGPATVFHPWDDIGDCWCAADSGGKSQIGILLARNIIPTDLIVEHIPSEATLDPGATPKDIELWVQILDATKREQVANAAISLFPREVKPSYENSPSVGSVADEPSARPALDETWVRVGRWQYSLHKASNVQSFQIKVPLEHFNAPVRKVAIRTLSNWGNSEHVCLYRLKLHGLLAQGENMTSTIT